MRIVVYRTETCTDCHMLINWLDKHQIPYEPKFVDKDPSIQEEMLKLSKGVREVPFSVVTMDDDTVITVEGYDRMKLSQILGITQVS